MTRGSLITCRWPRRSCASPPAAIAKTSARSLVLDRSRDVEQQLRSRFDWLREPDPAAVATPLILIVFDIMYRDRRDLAGLPLSARRIHLEDVIAGADMVLPVQRLAANGLDAWAQVVGNGYEGPGRQGRGQRARGRADEAVAEGEAAGWTVEEDRWKRRISAAPPAGDPHGDDDVEIIIRQGVEVAYRQAASRWSPSRQVIPFI
jgi:hypothetical protein